MSVRMLRAALVASVVASTSLLAAVHKNVAVGKFDPSFDISECEGKTFLDFMKKKIYPAMKEEAKNKYGKPHFQGVQEGQGVEIRLTDDVTTYHVRYKADNEKNAERSGRSFAAVGKVRGGKIPYVADASDAYYLDTLEKVAQDEAQLRLYFETILGVIMKCDVSGFDDLELQTKQLAADFVAVYVAEEYRHLVGGKGKSLGTKFNWDDALLQVTLLGAYHSGQDKKKGMFYWGKFTNSVPEQVYYEDKQGNLTTVRQKDKKAPKHCPYQFRGQHPRQAEMEEREPVLRDYWQMNRECKRSGINVTRSDFSKMAKAVSAWLEDNKPKHLNSLLSQLGENAKSENVFGSVSKYLINDTTPTSLGNRADKLTDSVVALLMEVRENADEITDSIE